MLKYPHSNPECENDTNYWFGYLLFENPKEQLEQEIFLDFSEEHGYVYHIPFNHPLSETVHKNMDEVETVYPVDWNNIVSNQPIVVKKDIGDVLIEGMVDKINEEKKKMRNPGNGEIQPEVEYDSDGREMNILDKFGRTVKNFVSDSLAKIKNHK